jgi:Cu2+-exporting ATPase
MRTVLVHSLPGRARFRVLPEALAGRDIAGFASALGGIPGVRGVRLSPRTGSILIIYDSSGLSEEQLMRAMIRIGAPGKLARQAAQEKSLALSWLGWQLFRLCLPPSFKPFVTMVRAIPFFAAGLRSLVHARLDLPALDAAAVGAALAQRDFTSASTLMMLLKTGEYLEAWARERSRENLAAAFSLNVGQVWIRDEEGGERQIPYEQLQPGDNVVLRSGALIPVDGTVRAGRATVNEAAMTGEPLGVEKTPGNVVHAGTVIEEGELVAEVRCKGASTRYEQIIRLIEESESARAETEVRANRLADRAVPVTFAAALLTLLISRNPRKAALALSVDYSCAIKLATPLAFLAAIREGLQNGVFFKGGVAIEKLAGADTVVFDKTGTLTQATPALERIIPYNGFSESQALKVAACLEEHFPHPVARAVVAAAVRREIRHREDHSTVTYITAHGIVAEYRGSRTVIGSRHFIGEDEGIDLSLARQDEEQAAADGCSVLYLASGGKLSALLLITDPLREEAPEVVSMLRACGIKRFYLLSGDNPKTAERIARELSLDGGRGGLLPQDKTAIIRNLRDQGCRIAFVGDGMNDSPAMSTADVGIAMKDGADLARETANITLREASMYPLVVARLVAQRVMGRIEANTRASLLLNSLFLAWGLATTPRTGAGGAASRSVWLHNLTTLAISANAMRPTLKEVRR